MVWPFSKKSSQDAGEGSSQETPSPLKATIGSPTDFRRVGGVETITQPTSAPPPPPTPTRAPPPPPTRPPPPTPPHDLHNTPLLPTLHATSTLLISPSTPTRPSRRAINRKPVPQPRTPKELDNEQTMMTEFFRQEHEVMSAKKKRPNFREYPIHMCQTPEQTQLEEARLKRNEQKRIYRLAAQKTGLAGLGEKVSFKGPSRSSEASDGAGEGPSSEAKTHGGKLIPSPLAQVNLAYMKVIAAQMDPGPTAGLEDVFVDDDKSNKTGNQSMEAVEGEGLAQLIERAEARGPCGGNEATKYQDVDTGKFKVYVNELLSNAAVKRLSSVREWVPRYLYRAVYFDPEDVEDRSPLNFLGAVADIREYTIGDLKLSLEEDLTSPIPKIDGVFARWGSSLLWAIICAIKFNVGVDRGTVHVCILDTMSSSLISAYPTKFLLDECGCQTGSRKLNLEFPGEHLVCRNPHGDVKMAFIRWEELREAGIMRLLPDLDTFGEPDGEALLAMKGIRFQNFEMGREKPVTEEQAMIAAGIATLVGQKVEMPLLVALLTMMKRPHMDGMILKYLKTLTAGADYPRRHVFRSGNMGMPPGVPELEEFARISCDWIRELIAMLADAISVD